MAYVNKVKANKATTIPDVGEHDSLLSCWTNLNTHRKGMKTSSNCVSKQKNRKRQTGEGGQREKETVGRRRQTKRHICRLIVMDSNTLGAPGRTNERLRSASGLNRRRSRRRRRSRTEPDQLRGELSRVELSHTQRVESSTANGQTMAANLRPTYAGMWHVAVSFVLATAEGKRGGPPLPFFGASCGTPRVLSAHYEATCSAH